jgi:hypothetical protein
MNKKDFLCNICNKNYASASSLCNHNKKYHQSIQNNFSLKCQENVKKCQEMSSERQENVKKCQKILNQLYNCRYCNKFYDKRQSRWYHEQKCELKNNKNNELEILKNEINKLKLTLQKTLKIKAKKNIFNNCNNNNNNTINNNTINIVKFGSEKLQDIYTDKQMFNLINSGRLCIEKSIKYIHFNDKKPEYKNIFITNLKDKYAYVFDGDNFIIKEKDEVLDELLDNHAYNIKEFVEQNRNDLPEHTQRSMDRFLNFIYDKNNNDEYVNFDKYKLNNIKVLVYNLSNKNTNLININCN